MAGSMLWRLEVVAVDDERSPRSDGQDGLADLVRAQAEAIEAWEAAELHLLEQALRERLTVLGISPTPDVAVALMATAMLLAEHAPEWGGDVRCSLGEIAQLGLRLLDGGDVGDREAPA